MASLNGCNQLLTDPNSYLLSSGYPERTSNPGGLECTYTISLPGDRRILLQWEYFSLGTSCTSGRVEVRHPGFHDDVIKREHFLCYWPFVRGIHRSPVGSPHKGQWHGALIFSLICAWTNGWENNRDGGDLRRYGAHWYITIMHLASWLHLAFQDCCTDMILSTVSWPSKP